MQFHLREAIARISHRSLQLWLIVREDGRIIHVRDRDGGRARDGHGLSLVHRHEGCGADDVHGLSLRLRHVVDGGIPVYRSGYATDADTAGVATSCCELWAFDISIGEAGMG